MQPTAPDQWQELAQQLLQVRRPAQAEMVVRQHLSQHPQDAFAHVLLALALLHQQRFVEARTVIQESLTLDAEFSEAYYVLGAISNRSGNYQAAVETLQQALRLDPHNLKYLGLLAVALNNSHQPEAALRTALRGLTLDPTHVECLAQQLQALRKLGQTRDAWQVTQQLLQSYPQLASAHLFAGEAAVERQDFLEAERRFREALRLDPDDGWAKPRLLKVLLCLGTAARNQSEPAKAAVYFQEALQLDPTCQEALHHAPPSRFDAWLVGGVGWGVATLLIALLVPPLQPLIWLAVVGGLVFPVHDVWPLQWRKPARWPLGMPLVLLLFGQGSVALLYAHTTSSAAATPRAQQFLACFGIVLVLYQVFRSDHRKQGK